MCSTKFKSTSLYKCEMEAKKRKARFSVHEIDVLVHEVYKNRTTLFSKLCTTVSNEKKMTVWQSITESVNRVCTVQPRTAEEVRRKWYYYLSDKKKEIAHRNVSRKTECNPQLLKYNPADLKILELLSEIDAAGGGSALHGAVEGLICEVDAEALSLRPSSASSDFDPSEEQRGPSGLTSPESSILQLPQEKTTPADHQAAACTPKITTHKECLVARHDANNVKFFQPNAKRERLCANDSVCSAELLRLEKKRLELQECQLRVLKDIHRQMEVDSQRNHSFQQAFLEIQRQRLELERAATQ
ncbi:uncharacterized protein [Panulirus ornatus]|uniref:uncharacterized protein n=1 Tax=Panulirus ornatus TaxID=150431 RepID=UPI003A84C5B9